MTIERATPPTPDGPPPVTDEMVALYRLAVEIQNDGDSIERWENDELPGRRRTYLDACRDLHTLLDRRPWQVEVTDTIDQDAPPSWMRADRHNDWHAARAIRIALEEAADVA